MANTAPKNRSAWDDPENEAQNNFIKWGAPGDFVYGVLLGTRRVKSTLPDKAGEMQTIYDVKVREGEFHDIDDKKKVADEATALNEGDIVSIGGRSTIDTRLARAAVGQVIGLKFIEEQPSKTKGYNPTKVIRVFLPKNADGSFEMDEAVLAEHKDELDQFDSKK